MTLLPRLSVLTLVALCLFTSKLIFAQSASDELTAQVGINICGNAIIETPAEDCEGLDLGGASCVSLGYSGGDLSCDVACTFDTTLCLSPTPTPTPSVGPTPSPTSTPTPTHSSSTPSPTPTSSSPATVTSVPITTLAPSPTLPVITQFISSLPSPLVSLLRSTGIEASDSLALSSLDKIIGTWVASWLRDSSLLTFAPRSPDIAFLVPLGFTLPLDIPNCDINEDKLCDLTDFSVILFYFNR